MNNDPIPKVKKDICYKCPKRWVTETSNCHMTCKEYIDLQEYNRTMREIKDKIHRSTKYSNRKGQM